LDIRSELIEVFYQNKNAELSEKMAAYMKNKFPFLGIQKPARTALARDFIKQLRKSVAIDWKFIFMLWDLPEREFQYLAIDYLLALKELLGPGDIDKLAKLVTQKSWWDSVDSIAENLVGLLCAKYPELIVSHILQWAEGENIWLVRIAIIFQLRYKTKTNTEVLGDVIRKNSTTREFFINKAIGWALREYSKTNREWVTAFIAKNTLQPLSVREGSKYL